MTANIRITVARRQPGEDALGQPIETWAAVGAYWADVRFQSGLAAIRADARTSLVQASVRVRNAVDAQAGDRVTLADGTVLDIEAVLPDLKGRMHKDLVCKGAAA